MKKRNLLFKISISMFSIPAILCAIFAYEEISYRLLPVLSGYNTDLTWHFPGIDQVLPKSVGRRIGKASNGDPLLEIRGDPSRNLVYREKYPHWWTGMAFVTNKKGVPSPTLNSLDISEIHLLSWGDPHYDKLSVLGTTKNRAIINAFVNPLIHKKLTFIPDGGKVVNVELYSPRYPGVYFWTVVIVQGGKGYIRTNIPKSPYDEEDYQLSPSFNEWLQQIQKADPKAFGP